MRQAALQLKNHIQNVNTMSNNAEVQRLALNIMLSIITGLALMYVLILSKTVFNIVERRTFEKEALTLSNEVSNLELSYLSTSSSVDVPLSHAMGFKEATPNFATRKALGSNGNLKLAQNEI